MASKTPFNINTILWTDLLTTDLAASKKFYGDLFGWQALDVAGTEGPYTILSLENESVGAMLPMDLDMKAHNIPPHWTVYIYVEDLDATLAAIRQHGGRVLCGPTNVMTKGKMATGLDPQGASFNLWQPIQHFGAERIGKDGGMTWLELMSADPLAGLTFYSQVFGWTSETMQSEKMTYHLMMSGKNPVGGAMGLPTGSPMPSCWAVYFQVNDLGSTITRAQSLGATLHVPQTAVPDKGSFALMADPQGALFYLWRKA